MPRSKQMGESLEQVVVRIAEQTIRRARTAEPREVPFSVIQGGVTTVMGKLLKRLGGILIEEAKAGVSEPIKRRGRKPRGASAVDSEAPKKTRGKPGPKPKVKTEETPPAEKIRKKPGPKPKVKTEETSPAEKIRKKPGPKPKVKAEEPAEAAKGPTEPPLDTTPETPAAAESETGTGGNSGAASSGRILTTLKGSSGVSRM